MRTNGLFRLITIAGALLCGASIQADEIQPFTGETFAELKAAFAGRPFLVSVWSLDCAPCRQDLAILGELKAANPDFPLVLISTDPIERREAALYVLEDHKLDQITSYIFADRFVERLRFSIDPLWYGELPRSYFFDAGHDTTAHSGVLKRGMLDAMLAPE